MIYNPFFCQKETKFLCTNKILTSNKTNAKKTWELINNFIGKTNNKRSCIDSLNASTGHINDHKEIAEDLFTNVGKQQSKQIGQSATPVAQYLKYINFNKTLYLQPTDIGLGLISSP